MNLVFDTSILIDIQRGNSETISKLGELKDLYPSIPKISFMSYFEFIYGLRKKSQKNKEITLAFLEDFPVIQTTKQTANLLAILKEKYSLSLADLFIVAQVLEVNGLLVSRDKDFEVITELKKIIF